MLGSEGGLQGNMQADRDITRQPFRVLVVGVPSKIEILVSEFERLGYSTRFVSVGAAAIWTALRWPADVVAVDFSEQVDIRLQWCMSLRSTPGMAATPLVAVTHPDQRGLRVDLLAAKIDDCLVGPHLSDEADLRIKALLRRAALPAHGPGQLRYADIILDPAQLKVWRNGVRVDLTLLPFRVLQVLMMNPETVVSLDELRALVWRDKSVEDVTIAKCLSRLHQSLRKAGGNIIRHVRGVGYSLDAEISNGSELDHYSVT